MKKIIILLLGICSLLFIALSCGDNKAKIELKKIVAELNSHCPVQYDFATCAGAEIEDGNLVLNYVYDENIVRLDHLNDESELAKKLNGSFLVDADKTLTDLLIRAGYGYTAHFINSRTNEMTTFHLSPNEIKNIIEHPESKNDLLDWQIQNMNSILPQQADEISVLTSVDCSDDIVSYYFEIDDDMVNLAAMNEVYNEMRENIKQALVKECASPYSSSKDFLTLICQTNKSLRQVYRGKNSGDEMVIIFPNGELRDMIHNYIEEE